MASSTTPSNNPPNPSTSTSSSQGRGRKRGTSFSSHRSGAGAGSGSGSGSGPGVGPGASSGSGRSDDDFDVLDGADAEQVNSLVRSLIASRRFQNAVADSIQANPGQLRGPPGPTGPTGPPGIGSGGGPGVHWRPEEVGFFFPDLNAAYGSGDVVTIGKETFFRNLSTFLDRLNDMVQLRGGEMVRTNLSTCLRGAALQWYTSELTSEEKQRLREPGVTGRTDEIHR